MARPVAIKNGVDPLNVRVPADLAKAAKGTLVTLPVAGQSITVKTSNKIPMSCPMAC
jgi:hypothetical protein